MKLIALKKIARGTPPGHVFEIRDKEGRALIALKLAKPFTAEDDSVVTFDANETINLASVEAPRQRRRYQRRDLTAAD